jgi:hypothetical protein
MRFITATTLFVFLLCTPVSSQTGKPSSLAELASYTGSDRDHLLLEDARTTAAVTADSNDNETSRIASTETMNVVEMAPMKVPLTDQPRKAARLSPPAVTKIELRK